jgi:methyltransferase
VSPVPLVVALVALQRLGEVAYAGRNTRRLLAAGGIEHGRRHYPLFVLLHGSWLAAILVAVPWDTRPQPLLLGAFILLQPVRLWVILALGGRWTTRVIVVPGAPLVRCGPFRLLRHPNYPVVTAEIALLPLAFGAWGVALAWSLLNAVLLAWRIRVEEAALAGAMTAEVEKTL